MKESVTASNPDPNGGFTVTSKTALVSASFTVADQVCVSPGSILGYPFIFHVNSLSFFVIKSSPDTVDPLFEIVIPSASSAQARLKLITGLQVVTLVIVIRLVDPQEAPSLSVVAAAAPTVVRDGEPLFHSHSARIPSLRAISTDEELELDASYDAAAPQPFDESKLNPLRDVFTAVAEPSAAYNTV